MKFQDIRGNLNTRLSKLDATDGPYNAIILAAAGIKRLKFDSRISKVSTHAINQKFSGSIACIQHNFPKKFLIQVIFLGSRWRREP